MIAGLKRAIAILHRAKDEYPLSEVEHVDDLIHSLIALLVDEIKRLSARREL